MELLILKARDDESEGAREKIFVIRSLCYWIEWAKRRWGEGAKMRKCEDENRESKILGLIEEVETV